MRRLIELPEMPPGVSRTSADALSALHKAKTARMFSEFVSPTATRIARDSRPGTAVFMANKEFKYTKSDLSMSCFRPLRAQLHMPGFALQGLPLYGTTIVRGPSSISSGKSA